MSQGGSPVLCKTLCLPKRGNSAEEYEDAFAVNTPRGRFAIADGASESSFAGLWARMLVNDFVNATSPDLAPWRTWLPSLQQRWTADIGSAAMPWFAEIKLQQGAFATFLGLAVQNDRWQAVAVGDSCLFQTRGNRMHCAFPLVCADDFGVTPWLVGSRGCDAAAIENRTRRIDGNWQSSDRLWLMTDALAKWFLEQVERCGQPWTELDRLLQTASPEQAFTDWVTALRDTGKLHNDDVTLLVIQR